MILGTAAEAISLLYSDAANATAPHSAARSMLGAAIHDFNEIMNRTVVVRVAHHFLLTRRREDRKDAFCQTLRAPMKNEVVRLRM